LRRTLPRLLKILHVISGFQAGLGFAACFDYRVENDTTVDPMP